MNGMLYMSKLWCNHAWPHNLYNW